MAGFSSQILLSFNSPIASMLFLHPFGSQPYHHILIDIPPWKS